MEVVVHPRDRLNPYQSLLYERVARRGAAIRFLEGPTGSMTVNILLVPLQLVARRCRGARLLHLHWVYDFVPPWARTVPTARRCFEAWFGGCLRLAGRLGYRVVWTAHNLLPHETVFADDLRARRTLVRRSDAVIAHSARMADEIARRFGHPRVVVVPEGSYVGAYDADVDRQAARRSLGLSDGDFVVAWLGSVHAYKGVDTLLDAAARVPREVPLRVLVAGACPDRRLRQELGAASDALDGRAVVHLGRVADADVQRYLRAADVAAFPFRRITSSGSLLLALSFGLPVLVPDLPELADLPPSLSVHYGSGADDLARAITAAAALPSARLADMAAAAFEFARARSWDAAAAATYGLYVDLTATAAGTATAAKAARAAPAAGARL